MSELWTEVWTRPGHATFGRLIDDPPISSGGFGDGINRIGNGNLSLPSSFDRFPEILADTASSLVRVFSERNPNTPIFEWIPDSLEPTAQKNDPTVEVTGQGIKGILSYARLEPWDWDGTDVYAPKVPDWVFGGPDIMTNGDFETLPFPNGGFEDGTNDYWNITNPDGFLTAAASIQAVNNPGLAESGDWYGLVDPISAKSGATRTFSGLVVGETYTITGFLNEPTASGDRYRAGIQGAVTASHTNAYLADGYWWAELDNVASGGGASDGTWQTFSLIFEAGETSAQLVIIFDDPGAGPSFRLDSWNIDGTGMGLYPWEARYPTRTNTFEFNGTNFHSGAGSAAVQGNDQAWTSPYGATGFGRIGIQQARTLKIGQPYTASVWVRQNSGSTQRFILAIIRQSPVGAEGSPGSSYMANVVVDVPTGVWTQLSEPFTADVAEVWFYVSWVYTGAFDTALHASPTYFVDDAVLFEGLPKTTMGDICLQIYDDATINHTGRVVWDDDANPGNPYLIPDFDEVVDSGGNYWLHPEISTRLTMRMSYSQIMAALAREYGYEYRIVPSDVENGIWLWQIYNPGGMSTDRGSDYTPAIQGGSVDVGRSVRQYLPKATDVMVEGLGRLTGRDRNATLITALGRIEGSILSREATQEDGVAAAATEAISFTSESGMYRLVDPPDQPLSDYALGDIIHVEDPPELSEDLRFVQVNVSYTAERTEWETQFGLAVTTDAAASVAEAVEMLTGKFEYPDELGGGGPAIVAGGGSGVPRIVISAPDASQMSIDKSDLDGNTTDSAPVLEAALTDEGEIRITEGNLNLGDAVFVFPDGTYITGAGRNASFLLVDDTGTTDWTFSGQGGMRFIRVTEECS